MAVGSLDITLPELVSEPETVGEREYDGLDLAVALLQSQQKDPGRGRDGVFVVQRHH
jgi:hypothetical protein